MSIICQEAMSTQCHTYTDRLNNLHRNARRGFRHHKRLTSSETAFTSAQRNVHIFYSDYACCNVKQFAQIRHVIQVKSIEAFVLLRFS